MTSRSPTDPDMLEMAARLADLQLTPARARELVPLMEGIYGLLDSLEQSALGEVAPAAAFKAQWGR